MSRRRLSGLILALAFCLAATAAGENFPAGDVNMDGVVDGRDAVRLMKYLAEEPETEISRNAADTTGNNGIDEADVLRLVQYLGGEEVTLDCPESADTEQDMADAATRLYSLGLMEAQEKKADGTPEFGLDGIPTLEEAVVMSVRLAGKEKEALEGSWEQPYGGVSEEAAPYVGYAYAHGILEDAVKIREDSGNGGSPFGEGDHVMAAQYIGMILQALGYSSGTDFRPDYPWLLSDEIALTRGQYGENSYDPDFRFTRGNMAVITANALDYSIRGAGQTVVQNLMDSGTVTGRGVLQSVSSPAGADVYVDGVFSGRTAPCALLLDAGEYEVEYRVPGYIPYKGKIRVEDRQTVTLDARLSVEIPEAVTITVTSESAEPVNYDRERELTVADLGGEVTLREALCAIRNDPTDTMYRIEFTENVKEIRFTDQEKFCRGNLVINGDRDLDGKPDVAIINDYPGGGGMGLLFAGGENICLTGLKFQGKQAFTIAPDLDLAEPVAMKNIQVLGCELTDNDLIGFGATCLPYNTKGRVDYQNLNFSGNSVSGGGNVFFAFCGNCDDCTAEGITYCANTLTDDCCLSVLASDCNTRYVFGPDTENGNGGTPGAFEICERNTVRNVLVSGNTGGRYCFCPSNNGNRDNTLEQVTIRNNVVTDSMFVRSIQQLDEHSEGKTLDTSGNVISDILIENNVIDNTDRESNIWISLLSQEENDPSSVMKADGNVIRNLTLRDNRYYRGTHRCGIGEGIRYTLVSGDIVADIGTGIINEELEHDNRYEGITFQGNRIITEAYDPFRVIP